MFWNPRCMRVLQRASLGRDILKEWGLSSRMVYGAIIHIVMAKYKMYHGLSMPIKNTLR